MPSLTKELNEVNDPVLIDLCNQFAKQTSPFMKRYYVKQILYRITGADAIAPNSRGGNIDARDLYVIEQFMGRPFVGVDSENPNSLAADRLKKIYSDIEDMYYNYVNFRVYSGSFRFVTYVRENEDGSKYVDTSYIDEAAAELAAEGENISVLVYDYGKYLKYLDAKHGTDSFPAFAENYSALSDHYVQIISLIDNTNTIIGSEADAKINGTVKNDLIFSVPAIIP